MSHDSLYDVRQALHYYQMLILEKSFSTTRKDEYILAFLFDDRSSLFDHLPISPWSSVPILKMCGESCSSIAYSEKSIGRKHPIDLYEALNNKESFTVIEKERSCQQRDPQWPWTSSWFSSRWVEVWLRIRVVWKRSAEALSECERIYPFSSCSWYFCFLWHWSHTTAGTNGLQVSSRICSKLSTNKDVKWRTRKRQSIKWKTLCKRSFLRVETKVI